MVQEWPRYEQQGIVLARPERFDPYRKPRFHAGLRA